MSLLDEHTVNKAQLDAVISQVKSQVITVNIKVTQNKIDIATIRYHYFTDQLKHNNNKTVKFPAVSNNYPIYTKGKRRQFIIYDDTNRTDLFVSNLVTLSSWSPITINTVIPITTTI